MLKIFREIRYKLIKDGNLKKYLIYSFGEILIVMIGILFALQINNWNEDRKNRKDETYYLSKIKSNLEMDVELLSAYIESDNMQMIQLDSLLIMLQNPEEYNNKYFADKSMVVQLNLRFVPTKITFENLVAANNLGIIKNQNILDNLFSYYRGIESIVMIMEEAFTFYNRNFIVPIFAKFNYYEYTGSRYKYDFSHFIKQKPLIEYAKDAGTLNWLRGQLMFVESQYDYYSSIRDEAESVIAALNNELMVKEN